MELVRNRFPNAGAMADFVQHDPSILEQRPYKIAENVYFVGNNWCCCYLLTTEKGLVLIDCAFKESFYLLLDSIYRLGFNPRDVKHLLLTHGHFDHCGAAGLLQRLSGCEVWLNEREAFFFTERRDLIVNEDHVPEFTINHYYADSIDFGNILVRTVSTPGHTPGTTSMFFDIQHNGRTLTCGIHGGLGVSGLSKKELLAAGRPLETQLEYLDMLRQVKDYKVDIVLPSHPNHAVDYPVFDIAETEDGSGDGFVDPSAWSRMVQGKIDTMEKFLAAGK